MKGWNGSAFTTCTSGSTDNKIELVTVASVPGVSEEDFRRHAAAAKAGCPVSRALAAVGEITLEASLAG